MCAPIPKKKTTSLCVSVRLVRTHSIQRGTHTHTHAHSHSEYTYTSQSHVTAYKPLATPPPLTTQPPDHPTTPTPHPNQLRESRRAPVIIMNIVAARARVQHVCGWKYSLFHGENAPAREDNADNGVNAKLIFCRFYAFARVRVRARAIE